MITEEIPIIPKMKESRELVGMKKIQNVKPLILAKGTSIH
jgi:hypothetical protein